MRKPKVPVPPLPKKSYKITFLPQNKEIIVDPASMPYGRDGMPGSILDIANSIDEDMIDHACGGAVGCSTCHVYIEEGEDSCSEISDKEEDKLEKAPALQLNSRLACACVPDGSEDIVVSIPQWSKNEVKEKKH